MTEQERKIKLADILMSYAEDKNAVDTVLAMTRNDKTTFNDYLHALCNGLWYGNWPWTNYSKPTFKGDE